jgi:hypothetical protein
MTIVYFDIFEICKKNIFEIFKFWENFELENKIIFFILEF